MGVESVAFKKICKIHRKLPPGGILVFLTGKAEIIRMVNRLRRSLNSIGKREKFKGSGDVRVLQSQLDVINAPREMDDDELDGENENFDEYNDIDDDFNANYNFVSDSNDDNIPKEACVLPLYSLLSAEDQAKVFAPMPQNHRLIVVATNIAETSITIPGITYVVDTGRQKCRNYNSGTGVASYDIMVRPRKWLNFVFSCVVSERVTIYLQFELTIVNRSFFIFTKNSLEVDQ